MLVVLLLLVVVVVLLLLLFLKWLAPLRAWCAFLFVCLGVRVPNRSDMYRSGYFYDLVRDPTDYSTLPTPIAPEALPTR